MLRILKENLKRDPNSPFGFVFDDGESISEHFHVTEVDYLTKTFIDCGGTVRTTFVVQLQVWLGNDTNHRLTAGKLAHVLDFAGRLIPNEDIEVQVEYEGCVISQYTIESVDTTGAQRMFRLADKHADCLAKEACGIEGAPVDVGSNGGRWTGCC